MVQLHSMQNEHIAHITTQIFVFLAAVAFLVLVVTPMTANAQVTSEAPVNSTEKDTEQLRDTLLSFKKMRKRQLDNRRKLKSKFQDLFSETQKQKPTDVADTKEKKKVISKTESVPATITTTATGATPATEASPIIQGVGTKKELAQVAYRLTNIANRLQSRMLLLEHQGYTLSNKVKNNLDEADLLLKQTSDSLAQEATLKEQQLNKLSKKLKAVKQLLSKNARLLQQLIAQ